MKQKNPIFNQKNWFSVKEIGQFHFWASLAIGLITSIVVTLLFNLIAKYFSILYWENEIRRFLYKQEGYNYGLKLNYYTDEIPIYPVFEQGQILKYSIPLSFVVVSLGLLITVRLWISSKMVTPKKYRHIKRWYATIFDSHFWNILHLFLKGCFIISIFFGFSSLLSKEILLLTSILLFIYAYLLSITSLRRIFVLNKLPAYLLLFCMIWMTFINLTLKPNFDGYEKAFEKHKANEIEWRKTEQLKRDEIMKDFAPPNSPD